VGDGGGLASKLSVEFLLLLLFYFWLFSLVVLMGGHISSAIALHLILSCPTTNRLLLRCQPRERENGSSSSSQNSPAAGPRRTAAPVQLLLQLLHFLLDND
jgi:hypothetical protein